MIFPLIALLIVGSASVSDDNSVDKDGNASNTREGQVIKILFNSIKLDKTKNEKLGVIIRQNGSENIRHSIVRQAHILAWFKYNCDDQYLTVNYFYFPVFENFNEQIYGTNNVNTQNVPKFWLFLQKITENKNIDTENIKQLKVPIPIGLQDDDLFNRMRKIDPYKPPVEIWAKMGIAEKDIHKFAIAVFDKNDPYYWGFKSDELEYIRCNDSYHGNFSIKIDKEIILPIEIAILEHETSGHWKEDFKKYKEDQIKKHGEAIGR